MGRKYRSFEEAFPDHEYDVDKAFQQWVAKFKPHHVLPEGLEMGFKAGWEAAEVMLMKKEG